MSNPNFTSILMILDVSGSMGEVVYKSGETKFKVMQDALHKMLEQQARKLAGYLTVDVGYFDNSRYWGERDADPLLLNLSLYAAGGTQLYDNAGKLLADFERKINALPEDQKPGHVVVIIMTDGDSSTPRQSEGVNIKSTIKRLMEVKGWDFAFLCATDYDMPEAIARLGLSNDRVINEPPTKRGIEKMAERLGEFVSMARSGERAHF